MTQYIIARSFREGKQLSTSQKTSSLFREEPTVLGHVLRRGSAPMKVSEEIYKLNETHLLALEKAGSITIKRPSIAAIAVEAKKACEVCGQVEAGQVGEYPCEKCGIPKLHDDQGTGGVQTMAPVEPVSETPPVSPEPVVEVPVVEAAPIVTPEVPEQIVSQLPESVAEVVKPQSKKGKK